MEERRRDYPNIVERLARIEERISNIDSHVVRLDNRVNGTFKVINDHIYEGEKSGGFRERLMRVETLVATATGERLNSVKASQWRVGIIVGIIASLPAMILAILRIYQVLNG